MQKFDVKVDDKGRVLMPRFVADGMKGKKLVMTFDNTEVRIMPQAMYRNLESM
ncbi:MAG TPA: hypothetical protein VJA47_02420 [archaeon]|nr:hypothetical protein [archaeon]